jgi:hypothetical protein
VPCNGSKSATALLEEPRLGWPSTKAGAPCTPAPEVKFEKFLRTINRDVPTDLDVHVVLDNASTRATPAIKGSSAGTGRGDARTQSPQGFGIRRGPGQTAVRPPSTGIAAPVM